MTNTHFHAGHNMPGYLPESDVATFDSFFDAKAYMIEVLDRDGDFLFDTDTEEGKEEADELSAEMQDLNLDSGPEWGTIVGNTSYWINACQEQECQPHSGHFSRLGGAWWCDTCDSPYCEQA